MGENKASIYYWRVASHHDPMKMDHWSSQKKWTNCNLFQGKAQSTPSQMSFPMFTSSAPPQPRPSLGQMILTPNTSFLTQTPFSLLPPRKTHSRTSGTHEYSQADGMRWNTPRYSSNDSPHRTAMSVERCIANFRNSRRPRLYQCIKMRRLRFCFFATMNIFLFSVHYECKADL